MVHVAPSRRLRRRQAEDGRVDIYRTLEGWGSLSLPKISFCISSLGVSHEQDLVFVPIKRGREGGNLRGCN
jgi:hypothetical protein